MHGMKHVLAVLLVAIGCMAEAQAQPVASNVPYATAHQRQVLDVYAPPGAKNLPFTELYNPDGTMKPPHELRRLFIGAGADPDKPFVASCGSGVTANSLILAARQLGNRDGRLYDGSWSEWGADPSTPKEEGPA